MTDRKRASFTYHGNLIYELKLAEENKDEVKWLLKFLLFNVL